MTQYTDYTKYFEALATEFCGHLPTEKHFFRKGLEEFLNGMQTSVNYPAMLLGRYDYQYNDNTSDDVSKVRTIAFIICDNVTDPEDYDKIDAAIDIAEEICDKIYNRIREDKKPSSQHEFLKYARLGNIQATPVENYADGNYGYYVTIEIFSHHDARI